MIKLGKIPPGMPQEEAEKYLDIFNEKHPEKKYSDGFLDITLQGDDVDLWLDEGTVPFQRIARITGYLTSTVDRWNNAKQHELQDRVKHGIM